MLELYEGLNEPGVPIVGGDTTRSELAMLSVTALGRSERVPGRAGAEPGDVLVVTGPLGGAGAAFSERPARASAAPSGRGEGAGARSPTRCSTSRTASRSTRVTSPRAPASAA